MAIDREIVRHVAKLARLALTPEEEETFARQLGAILGYVDQLAELDTTGLEPTSHSIGLQNVVRPDVRRPSTAAADVLAGAPDTEQRMFRVPKIL